MANQTVNSPSKMLMARLASFRVVLWALGTHGPRLVEIFNGPLGQSLPRDIRSIFELQISQLQKVLSAARDMLVTSDRKVRDQKALVIRFRRIRNDAEKALNPYVMGLKDTFRGACGREVTVDLGFALRIPEHPGELLEQAQHLTARLSESDVELPEIRYEGVTIDRAALVREMKPLVDSLGVALDDVAREEREVEAMKIAKDEAVATYDRTFGWAARSAESLFRMANLPEVAKRVRPSGRRAGLTVEVATQDPMSEDSETVAEATGANEAVSAEAMEDVPEASSKAKPDIPPTE